MSSPRKNWAEQYQIKQDEFREKFLKGKLYKLIEESKNTPGIRERLVKLKEVKEVFLDLSREAIEYDEEEEEKVDAEIKKLWKCLEEQHKRYCDSWDNFQGKRLDKGYSDYLEL